MNGMVEIRAPGAPPQRRALARDPVLLGRAPRRGIAVPTAHELADEHLILSLGKAGCHLALVPGAKLEPTLNGRSFRQRDVVWGDEVVIGRTSLRFLGKRASNGPSPILVIGVLIITAAIVWMAMIRDPESTFAGGTPQPLPLFNTPKACPSSGQSALALADETEQTAMARSERYNFEPQDGIRAVELYRFASNCYRAAGDGAAAQRVERVAKGWADRLDNRYQGHQLALRMAIDRRDGRRVLAEVAQLRALLKGRQAVYMDWLAWLEHKTSGK